MLFTLSVDYNNWLILGVGSTFVTDGDKAQFEHEQDTKNGPYGGVEDFHWQQFVGKKGLFRWTATGFRQP